MRPLRAILVLIVCLLSLCKVFGQVSAAQFQFSSLHVFGSLHHYNPITSIAQDRHGFLWLKGTSLYRYDGYTFKPYGQIQTLDKRIFYEGDLTVVFSDHLGRLWIGTKQQCILLYHPTEDTFEAINICTADPKVPDLINTIAEDGDHRIWAGSEEGGIFWLDESRKCLIKKSALPVFKLALCDDRLLAGGHLGIYAITAAQAPKLLHRFADHSAMGYLLDNVRINDIAMDGERRIWVSTNQFGAFCLGSDQKSLHLTYPEDSLMIPSNRIRGMFLDSQRRFWMLSEHGIHVFWPGKASPLRLRAHDNLPGMLRNHNSYCILEDRHGIIWIGTHRGLQKLDPYNPKFKLITHIRGEKQTLSNPDVLCVYEDRQQMLWVGTRDGALNRINRRTHQVEHIFPHFEHRNPINAVCEVRDIFPYNDKLFWLGTSEGVWSFDPATRRTRLLMPTSQKVRKIVKLRAGKYAVASGDGLFVTDSAFRKVQKLAYLPSYDHKGQLINTDVTNFVYEDELGFLWVGISNLKQPGLIQVHPGTLKVRHFLLKNAEGQPVKDGYPSITMLRAGDTLWVGSFTQGLLYLDLKTRNEDGFIESTIQSLNRYNSELPDNSIYAILPDAQKRFWLSTNQGIVCFDPATRQATQYKNAEGVQSLEFNINAWHQNAKGEMFLGGINGLNYFHPEDIKTDTHKPAVQLLELHLLNQFDSTGRRHPVISLPGRHSVMLKISDLFFSINFTTDHYSRPNANRYKYRLEGRDERWISIDTARSISFNNLSPGTYKLYIRACNADGTWGDDSDTAKLTIYIEAPFWQTSWFYLFIVLISGIMAYTIVQFRYRRIEQRRQALEALIETRTQELREQNEFIERQNQSLKASQEDLIAMGQKRDMIFSVLSHDLRSPLTTLKGFLHVLPELIQHSTNVHELVFYIQKIELSVGASLDVIDNILFWSQTQMKAIQPTPEPIRLIGAVEKTVELYALTAAKKNIAIDVQVPDDIHILFDPGMLQIILRNLLSNALKFTWPGGHIQMRASIQGPHAILYIQDNGIGMSEEQLRQVFDEKKSLQVSRGTHNEKGTGLGLMLSRHFARWNGGNLHLQSQPNRGTVASLLCPMSSQAPTLGQTSAGEVA